ncbi:PREDICTED: uncharacterized protein LOC107169194 [Diuraphis noxia]|uniref:uncharacterized protein LOC107169194 n=1 Tax=Diuraphis noxia TaxID=143948 RepID=UPI0007636EBE|nr:PREDICTED: uncharacterized protein LOC107169194 [Diuraphis noxia]
MKLSIFLLLLTFVVTSLYARHVHQTSTNRSPNYKHQNRINSTTKINITTLVNPVGRNSKPFPACNTTKTCIRSNSTATNGKKFHTSSTTQKYTGTKSNGVDSITKKVVIVDDHTTTESDRIHSRFFINPPVKIKESDCTDGLTRSVNGNCVFKFSDD